MKKKSKSFIQYLLFFVICFGFGILLARITRHIDLLYFVFLILFFGVSFLLAIQIHELGHFLFGKISGYSLLELKIGSFSVRWENGKYKFVIERIKGLGGYCKMLPPTHDLTQKRQLLYYAGGILMNLISGLMAMGTALLFPHLNTYLILGLWIFGFVSVFLGLLNMRPLISANNPSDGKIIQSILKKDAFSRDFAFINTSLTDLTRGVRPKDLQVLNEQIDETEEPRELYIYKMVYHLYHAIDKEDKEKLSKCLRLLEAHKDKIPSAVEKPIYYEIAGGYCLLNEKQKALEYYTPYESFLQKENDLNGNRIRAYCAYIINENLPEALALCEKGLEVADSFPLKGQAIMEKELIDKLKKQIESKQTDRI